MAYEPIFHGGWGFNMAKVDMTIEVCGMSGDGTIAAGGENRQVGSTCLRKMDRGVVPANRMSK